MKQTKLKGASARRRASKRSQWTSPPWEHNHHHHATQALQQALSEHAPGTELSVRTLIPEPNQHHLAWAIRDMLRRAELLERRRTDLDLHRSVLIAALSTLNSAGHPQAAHTLSALERAWSASLEELSPSEWRSHFERQEQTERIATQLICSAGVPPLTHTHRNTH